jgi:hypothetical protein
MTDMTDAKSAPSKPSSGASIQNVLEKPTISNRSGAQMTHVTDVTAKQN